MAEADVETSNSSRFFCHKCSDEISPKLPEYVCPRCNSGFIEILDRSQESDSDSSDLDMDYIEFINDSQSSHNNSGNAESQGSSGGASSSGPRRSQRFRSSLYPRHGRRRLGHDRQQALAPILQEVIMQMTSSILGSGVAGGDLGIFQEGLELPAFPMLVSSNLASNPGDYAWGRGGLDSIITQLMNQLDGTGPPPLSQEKISQIPIVKISQEQFDKSLQCTVCMEDFKLDEYVRKLYCDHSYHEDCIIPWLKLHGTCPVCRKPVLNENGQSEPVSLAADSSDPNRRLNNIGGPRSSNNSSSNQRYNFMEEDLD